MKLSHVILGFIGILVVLPLVSMFVGERMLDPFGIDPTHALVVSRIFRTFSVGSWVEWFG